MGNQFETVPPTVLADYEEKLKRAGYVIFEHAGDWYYNEADAGDELSDGPYATRAEVLHVACHNLHLVENLPIAAISPR